MNLNSHIIMTLLFIILLYCHSFFIMIKKQGAWIPIYPFDVIKTNIQNTQGDTTNR